MRDSTKMRTQNLLALLRSETSQAHDTLDRAHDGGDFASLDDYGRFLETQARIFPAAEAYLAASPEFRTLSDWADRLRSDALMADLAALGRNQPPLLSFSFEDRPGVAAGIAYVLEGSRLGGKLIARKLERGGLQGAPVSFIAHGADDRFWPRFTAWLSARDQGKAYAEDALAAANATFGLFLVAVKQASEKSTASD